MSGKLVGCGRVSTRRAEDESRRSDNPGKIGRILNLPRPRRALLTGLKERPCETLEYICNDGAILATKTAIVWGWFQNGTRTFYLMKSPSGRFFAQVEHVLSDDAKIVPLPSRPEVVAVWNRCSVKLSASRLFA